MPRVSVIVPAFNAAETIADALGSVVSQSYADWEVVVVDDASTDGTPDVVQGFDPRVRLVRAERNAGPAAARNLALDRATGELVALLDADDYWLPRYLERQVGRFEESEGRVGIVACDARLLTPSGFLDETYLDVVGLPRDVSVGTLLRSNPIYVSALTSRRVIHEVGGFCEEIRGVEDHDLWLRIVERGLRVVIVREALAVYRVRSASLSAHPAPIAAATRMLLLRALARGNLTASQRRIARREMRRLLAIERIAAPGGLSVRGALRALPLLAVVAAENPRRWPSFARVLASRGSTLTRFGGQRG